MPLCQVTRWHAPAFIVWLWFSSVHADDWPQWRGPQRNGVAIEKDWTHEWHTAGPRKLWTAQLGEGYSSIAAANGRVYSMGSADGTDIVWCLDAVTGNVVWKHRYPHPQRFYGADPMPEGTASTPTVFGDRVFTLSREGLAFCLDSQTGNVAWSKDLIRETDAQTPEYGFTGSPLVEGDLVIYNVGTFGVALDRTNGRMVWKTGSHTAGYASPVVFTTDSRRAVAIVNSNSMVGVDLAGGRARWRVPWKSPSLFGVTAADPIIVPQASGNLFFVSAGYNRGCALLRQTGDRIERVWESKVMRNHFNSCVLVDGHLYGNDDGTLKCITMQTGEERWRQRGMGHGGLIAANGKLIVLTERGELRIVQATPDRYTLLVSARVLRGRCWTSPTLANGIIYCRNNDGEVGCFEVRPGK